jgi:hypothetical protein
MSILNLESTKLTTFSTEMKNAHASTALTSSTQGIVFAYTDDSSPFYRLEYSQYPHSSGYYGSSSYFEVCLSLVKPGSEICLHNQVYQYALASVFHNAEITFLPDCKYKVSFEISASRSATKTSVSWEIDGTDSSSCSGKVGMFASGVPPFQWRRISATANLKSCAHSQPEESDWKCNGQTGSCYKVVQTLKSWAGAQHYCAALPQPGSNLVSIQSPEENVFVKDLITQNGFADGFFKAWIGLTDEDTEGNWRWANGGSGGIPSYFNWAKYFPNGAGDHVILTSDGTWIDTSGDDDICLFVCKIPAPPCPEPKPLAHGAVSSQNDGIYTLESTITYHCNQGYTLKGSDVRTCNSSQLWSGIEPLCVPTAPLSIVTASVSAPYSFQSVSSSPAHAVYFASPEFESPRDVIVGVDMCGSSRKAQVFVSETVALPGPSSQDTTSHDANPGLNTYRLAVGSHKHLFVSVNVQDQATKDDSASPSFRLLFWPAVSSSWPSACGAVQVEATHNSVTVLVKGAAFLSDSSDSCSSGGGTSYHYVAYYSKNDGSGMPHSPCWMASNVDHTDVVSSAGSTVSLRISHLTKNTRYAIRVMVSSIDGKWSTFYQQVLVITAAHGTDVDAGGFNASANGSTAVRISKTETTAWVIIGAVAAVALCLLSVVYSVKWWQKHRGFGVMQLLLKRDLTRHTRLDEQDEEFDTQSAELDESTSEYCLEMNETVAAPHAELPVAAEAGIELSIDSEADSETKHGHEVDESTVRSDGDEGEV